MYSAAHMIMETAVKERDAGNGDFPLSEIFKQAVDFGVKRFKLQKSWDKTDEEILYCAAKRAWQICAPFEKLSTLQEASWLDEEEMIAEAAGTASVSDASNASDVTLQEIKDIREPRKKKKTKKAKMEAKAPQEPVKEKESSPNSSQLPVQIPQTDHGLAAGQGPDQNGMVLHVHQGSGSDLDLQINLTPSEEGGMDDIEAEIEDAWATQPNQDAQPNQPQVADHPEPQALQPPPLENEGPPVAVLVDERETRAQAQGDLVQAEREAADGAGPSREESARAKRKRKPKKKKKKVEYFPTDRIVVDGYHDFLIKSLDEASDQAERHLDTVVKQITSVKGRCIVSTAARKKYHADYVLVTLPVGVLKGKSEKSRVAFRPELSQEKLRAIQTFGMGSENKVILIFDPLAPFWPKTSPYFISTDDRFRFLNLGAYGKEGVIVVHGQPPFSWNWGALDDEDLVMEVRKTLQGMFALEDLPAPLYSHVTRWDTDEFSMGSYSYFAVNSTADTVDELATCEGLRGERRVHFAGEACSVDGHQCVHGAYTTGMDAARAILSRCKDGRDSGPPKHGYGAQTTPLQMIQCSACKQWVEVAMSKGEFKSLSANESEIWTCKVCEMKDQMRLEGVTLCGSCESLMARWEKKHHGKPVWEELRVGDSVRVPAQLGFYRAVIKKALDDPKRGRIFKVYFSDCSGGQACNRNTWLTEKDMVKPGDGKCTCGRQDVESMSRGSELRRVIEEVKEEE